ncbi:MAG: hydrogenase 3 maturation protease [Methanobacterium sp. PtaU1.Bin242]|nr:MAG: hydrogenase 3 maturation protease [Methanobacterium sp. PtaU1.Bin242]
MLELKLKEFLKNTDKLVILGIGNEMRGDDFLGSLLARKLAPIFKEREDVMVFDGGVVPENFTGTIKRESPSHIILIDAADMGKSPGHIRIIKKDEISKYHLSTHAMPLSFLIKYLEQTTRARIILIGIQPEEMDRVNKVSLKINESIEYLVDVFCKILND